MTNNKNKDSDYYQQQFDEAYRPSVGIVLFNNDGQILIAERIEGKNAWQFPQGGIDEGETIEEAVFREMEEEIGTRNAEVLGMTDKWFYDDFPPHVIGKFEKQYRGQRQKWVALRFKGKDSDIALDKYKIPEFKNWRWIEIDKAVEYVLHFRGKTYKKILEEFSKYVKMEKQV